MNDIQTLDFEWKAVYKDGSELIQNYGKGVNGGEHNFSHINQKQVKEFFLNSSFSVNIEEQSISILDLKFYVEFPRNKNGEKVKGKLVYFRRIKKDFTPDKGVITDIRYCIGLQANIDGVNYQQYVFINNDKTFTLSQLK